MIRSLVQFHVEDIACKVRLECLQDPRFDEILAWQRDTGACRLPQEDAMELARIIGQEIARQLAAAASGGAR